MATRDTHNLRSVLAVRGFRRLLGVRLSSQLADGLFQAALAGSVLFNPTGRPARWRSPPGRRCSSRRTR
ncbi:hypothetical protein [Phytohabitans suffuscus]|uniref:hypothetical protein n=1 Tax=Phytohabitans suffuscus TaxID=624315 RepID=UPI0015650730|nr:hypothetical protein [Phytohabitans suffuscus]